MNKTILAFALISIVCFFTSCTAVPTYDDGYDCGYSDGYEDGRTNSYWEGYQTGASEAKEEIVEVVSEHEEDLFFDDDYHHGLSPYDAYEILLDYSRNETIPEEDLKKAIDVIIWYLEEPDVYNVAEKVDVDP